MGKYKELPEGWEWKRLGDVTNIIMGQSPPGESYNEIGAGTPFLQGNAEFRLENPLHKKWTTDPLKMAKKGSVLISVRAPIGDINIADIDYCIGRGLASIDSQLMDKRYLFYLLKNEKQNIENKGTGTTFKAVSRSILVNLLLPIPPLETQRKIVAILDHAETTRQLRSQADTMTQQLLQSTFLEMFGDPLKNHRNWKTALLIDVAEVVSGVTKGRDFGGKNIIMAPYLRVANVQDGYLDLSEIKEIEALDSDIEKYALEEGDVLLTEGGDRDKLGRGAVWHGDIPNCIHQNHIFRVRANRDLLVPEYLSSLIGSTYGKLYFLRSAKQTTGIASINSTQLKNFPVIIPPIELQNHFADIVSHIQKTDNSMLSSRITFNQFYDSLMSKAFTGELVA